MAAFDLKAILKQIEPQLRRQLLEGFPSLGLFDWSTAGKTRDVDRLAGAILGCPKAEQLEIALLLQTCTSLRGSAGLKVIQQELSQRAPDLLATWKEIKRSTDKVVWTYLNARDVFKEAIVFARADALALRARWKKWPGVECNSFEASQERIDQLKSLLIAHHTPEGRGGTCVIHPYSRRNGAEYFFAYLPDWLAEFMVFSHEGELKALDVPAAFSILFVFTPRTGALEMIASGSDQVQLALRRAFYLAMTGTSVQDILPLRPAYELDHMLQDTFAFAGHDSGQVAEVHVTKITLVPTVGGCDFDCIHLHIVPGTTWRQVLSRLDLMLKGMDLDRSQVALDEVGFRIYCTPDERGKKSRFSFLVTPRSSNLKSIVDEDLRVLGERCLLAWGIDFE